MSADYRQYDYIDKRVRYFDTQFLKDQDFIDEQKYHIDRQRRQHRYLHVSGIVEGLTVEPGDGKNRDATFQATIAPGTALDSNGCQIVLVYTDPPATVGLESYRNQTVEVFISYQEIESDMAQEGGKANRRWHEKPLITVTKLDDPAPTQGIRLARLNVSSDGIVTIDRSDPTVRQYAGVNLPSADSRNPTLRAAGEAASSLAVLTGSLSISDNVGIGTQLPKDKLSIQGGALSFSNPDNAVPQVGIDYDKTTDTLRVRGNQNAQGLNTDLMVINRATGKVGIGTPSTGGGLEINRGNMNDLSLLLTSSGTGWGSGIQFANTAASARTYGIYAGSDGKLHFTDVTANVDRLTIDQTGNVGIGSIPDARLVVKLAEATANTSLKLEHNGSNFLVRPLAAGGSSTVIENTGGGALVINPDGANVGIGPSVPQAKLTVQTPNAYDGDTIRFEAKNEPSLYYLNLRTSVEDSIVRWVFDQINAGTTYSSILSFDRGNVGIGGVEKPSHKLSVSGITGIRQNSLYLSGDESWSSLSYNAHHNANNNNWVFPNPNRAAVTVEMDGGASGKNPRFEIYSTTASNTQTWTRRFAIDGHSGNTTISGNLTVNQLICQDKPIEITKYSNIGDNPNFRTAYSTNDWVCSIAGFYSGDGDINEAKVGVIVQVYTYPNADGFWYIRADFLTHNDMESWTIWLMSIRKHLAKATNAL